MSKSTRLCVIDGLPTPAAARKIYRIFIPLAPACLDIDRWQEGIVDIIFVGLIIVLAALTWGGIALCERLLTRP